MMFVAFFTHITHLMVVFEFLCIYFPVFNEIFVNGV